MRKSARTPQRPGSAAQPAPGSETTSPSQRGYSLIDLLFATALVSILAAIAVPLALTLIQRPRAHAAARYLAARMVRVRTQAVTRSATIALQFEEDAQGFTIGEFIDGNRNGVRTADIASGADQSLEGPVRLGDLFPRVAISLADDGGGADPVQIGATSLMSFTPYGTATSGTIYLLGEDGSRFAVRVLGASGRTRLLRYSASTGAWVELL